MMYVFFIGCRKIRKVANHFGYALRRKDFICDKIDQHRHCEEYNDEAISPSYVAENL